MAKRNVTKIETEPSPKQFTIFHVVNNDPEPYASSGNDYKLATIDIQSMHTGDVLVHPVVFVIDEEEDTMEMIPFSSVAKIRYNWGYKEESKKFITDPTLIKKKGEKARKQKAATQVQDSLLPKENNYTYMHG